jgi:hypothetical protein
MTRKELLRRALVGACCLASLATLAPATAQAPKKLHFEFGPSLGCDGGGGNLGGDTYLLCASYAAGPVVNSVAGATAAADGYWLPVTRAYWGLPFSTTNDSVLGENQVVFVGRDGKFLGSACAGGSLGPCSSEVGAPRGTAWLFVFSWAAPSRAMSITFKPHGSRIQFAYYTHGGGEDHEEMLRGTDTPAGRLTMGPVIEVLAAATSLHISLNDVGALDGERVSVLMFAFGAKGLRVLFDGCMPVRRVVTVGRAYRGAKVWIVIGNQTKKLPVENPIGTTPELLTVCGGYARGGVATLTGVRG